MKKNISIIIGLLLCAFFMTSTYANPIVGIGDKCVDARGESSADGTQVILYDCHYRENQQWTVEDNYGRQPGPIIGIGGQCLDVKGGDMTPGTPVILWRCKGSANQMWIRAGNKITNRGMCLNAEGGSSRNGTRLIVWPCEGAPNEKWSVY